MLLRRIEQTTQYTNDLADRNLLSRDQNWMRQYIGTESIWTIDLILLLQFILCDKTTEKTSDDSIPDTSIVLDTSMNLESLSSTSSSPLFSYVFCSTKLGVDESYNTLDYYEENFQQDLLRVQRHFEMALEKNLPLLQVSRLSLKILVDFISRKTCIAIVLIDNRVLFGRDRNAVDEFSCDTAAKNTYSGHYLIVCGVSYDKSDVSYAKSHSQEDSECDEEFCMVLKNPGCWKEQQFVTARRFELAWRSNGTDEDIILINLH